MEQFSMKFVDGSWNVYKTEIDEKGVSNEVLVSEHDTADEAQRAIDEAQKGENEVENDPKVASIATKDLRKQIVARKDLRKTIASKVDLRKKN